MTIIASAANALDGGKILCPRFVRNRSRIVDSGLLPGDLNLSSLALGPGSYLLLGLYLDVENNPVWMIYTALHRTRSNLIMEGIGRRRYITE